MLLADKLPERTTRGQLASFGWPEAALIHTVDGQFPLRLVILGVRKERALFPTGRPSEIKTC